LENTVALGNLQNNVSNLPLTVNSPVQQLEMNSETSTAIKTVDQMPCSRTICAVIVTYFPDAQLEERLRRITAQVAQTVIVDNGSPASCVERIREFGKSPAVHLILNESNEGIASALNAGVRWAASQGFQWVLTFDQDTVVSPGMVDEFEIVVGSYPEPARLAVVGSNYQDKVNGKLLSWSDRDTDNALSTKIPSVLTSGSLISVSAFQIIGGFRDGFFIDCVDHEYCLHARALGFDVVVTSKPVMRHEIGHVSEHRLFGKKVRAPNHSSVREYYRARNSIVLIREYLVREPRWVLYYMWSWLKSVVFISLFEKDRTQKLINTIRGCVDGLLGRTGIYKGAVE
jgi:rhamnosyltransferase